VYVLQANLSLTFPRLPPLLMLLLNVPIWESVIVSLESANVSRPIPGQLVIDVRPPTLPPPLDPPNHPHLLQLDASTTVLVMGSVSV
jgi:hypothetical protein